MTNRDVVLGCGFWIAVVLVGWLALKILMALFGWWFGPTDMTRIMIDNQKHRIQEERREAQQAMRDLYWRARALQELDGGR